MPSSSPAPRLAARSMVSLGMLLSSALSTASRNRGLPEGSAPPSLAATVISRIRRVKILPRLASVAAFLCLMFAHLLWPAMMTVLRCVASIANYISATRMLRRLEYFLVLEKLLQHLQPYFAVVDLEH